MSGKGGVGKSSVAAYLAVGLARLGFRVGLMDVDLHGPSIPGMLGITGPFDANEEGLIPKSCADRLKVVSMQCLLEDEDSAVIWRGPVKSGVIRQFISDVNWGDLDYLVIDAPPGTGDEPLSVAQTVAGAQAVIVTTPQEVALADVRKSINFCRKVGMPILGLVENMSGLICPHCEKEIPLFGKGGGLKTARKMDVHFLGSLPFDPRVAEGSDSGKTLFQSLSNAPFIQSLNDVITGVLSRCNVVQKSSDHAAGVA
jgi:Mrp family chromosome partitioning ATPase